MNEQILELAKQCGYWSGQTIEMNDVGIGKFARLILKDCIDKIETHRIPVGNSPAGELACTWTYDALKEIIDEIKEHFGVEE